jgi:hypothetical protein
MPMALRAFELEGTVDEHRQLHLDQPVPVPGPSRVRVIILVLEDAEAEEREWLQAAARNPAFDFLHDPGEDRYTLEDGRPYHGSG